RNNVAKLHRPARCRREKCLFLGIQSKILQLCDYILCLTGECIAAAWPRAETHKLLRLSVSALAVELVPLKFLRRFLSAASKQKCRKQCRRQLRCHCSAQEMRRANDG